MSSEKFEDWGGRGIDKYMVFDAIIKVSLVVLGIFTFAIAVDGFTTKYELIAGTVVSVCLIMIPLLMMGASTSRLLERLCNKFF